MRFVVKPVESKGPIYTTQCVLCSEDPRWCVYS
jgi:hypothetical protein